MFTLPIFFLPVCSSGFGAAVSIHTKYDIVSDQFLSELALGLLNQLAGLREGKGQGEEDSYL